MYREQIGKKLKTARKRAGYTQKQIEDITDIPQSTISKIEKGKQFNIEDLCILIDFYEVNADWVLGTGITKK